MGYLGLPLKLYLCKVQSDYHWYLAGNGYSITKRVIFIKRLHIPKSTENVFCLHQTISILPPSHRKRGVAYEEAEDLVPHIFLHEDATFFTASPTTLRIVA